MYLSYYGLYKEPFHITPDPEFLFESPSHKEAYAAIVYGVEQRKGFIAVTGEVGTGKTTVVRAFLKGLDRDRAQPIYVFNPDLSFDDLLRLILNELGMDPVEMSQAAMLQWLHWTLINHYKDNRGILLVVDEAQNMPVETLEKLRMLSNLETTEEKLLQIVLVGQPELDEKLNLHQLRQLKQRLAVRATLRPLTTQQSLEYIQHRFERAGGSFEGIFTPGAIKALARQAAGSPRALNILCDNVLLAGFGAEQRPIAAGLVREVARDLAGRRTSQWTAARVRWALGAAAAAVLLAAGLGFAVLPDREGEIAHAADTMAKAAPSPVVQPVSDAMVENPGSPAAEARLEQTPDVETPDAMAEPAIVPDAEPAVLAEAVAPVAEALPAPADPVVEKESETVVVAKAVSATPTKAPAKALNVAPEPTVAPAETVSAKAVEATAPAPAAVAPLEEPRKVVRADASTPPAPPKKADPAGPGELTRVVRPGENLTRLVTELYGRCDERLLLAVQVRNPFITDVNMILTGQQLVFPTIDGAAPLAWSPQTSDPEGTGSEDRT